MLDRFLYIGLPYVALFVLVFGTVYRFRTGLGLSARSSQLLESRKLAWGSAAWHAGILVVLAGHLAALLAPSLWISLTSSRALLLGIEGLGLAAATLGVGGLVALVLRRLTSSWLQPVTRAADMGVLALLLIQIILGIAVAIGHRWGAAWSAGTTTPYLWSLLTFRPEPDYVTDLHPIIQAHIVGAWVIFLLVPFTRLVHLFAVPLHYLVRAPQRVLWTSRRYAEVLESAPGGDPADGRRSLVRGTLALGAAVMLLGVGAADKLLGFLGKQRLTRQQQTDQMARRHARVQLTAEERALELERMRNEYIFVARLGELERLRGKYFVDYQMRPALAFQGADGLPNLLSARCTHLGCTVGSEADDKGRVLCPCHISFFDIVTGQPNPGAPAREPLEKLGWVLRDDQGKVVAKMSPSGRREGEVDPAARDGLGVYLAMAFEEERP